MPNGYREMDRCNVAVFTERYKTQNVVWWIGMSDLIITSMLLMAFISFVIRDGILVAVDPDAAAHTQYSNSNMATVLLGGVIIIYIIIIVAQLVAAVKLMNASQLGKRPDSALQLCECWSASTIATILAIVSLSITLFCWEYSPLVISIHLLHVVMRCCWFYLVERFMNELSVNIGPMIHQTMSDSVTRENVQDQKNAQDSAGSAQNVPRIAAETQNGAQCENTAIFFAVGGKMGVFYPGPAIPDPTLIPCPGDTETDDDDIVHYVDNQRQVSIDSYDYDFYDPPPAYDDVIL